MVGQLPLEEEIVGSTPTPAALGFCLRHRAGLSVVQETEYTLTSVTTKSTRELLLIKILKKS